MTRETSMNPADVARRRELVFDIVRNQLKDNNPPETRQTYERLLTEGIEADEVMRLIGCVLASEIYEISRFDRPFDLARYVTLLDALPELPWKDNEARQQSQAVVNPRRKRLRPMPKRK